MTSLRSPGLIGILLATTLASRAAAQASEPTASTPTNEWTFTIAPYAVLAGLSGTVGIRDFEQEVDISTSEFLSHFRGGFMGYFDAHKNGWGIGVETIFLNLGSAATEGPLRIEPSVSAQIYTVLGSRRVIPGLELLVGARVNSATNSLTFEAAGRQERSESKTWVDPVAGVNVVLPINEKNKVVLLGTLGGFGVNSAIAADLFPTYQFRLATHAWLGLGYRYIYTNYSDDAGFAYRVSVQGPALGAVFPF